MNNGLITYEIEVELLHTPISVEKQNEGRTRIFSLYWRLLWFVLSKRIEFVNIIH